MALTSNDVQTLAQLTQLRPDSTCIDSLTNSLNQLITPAVTICSADTTNIEPMVNPLDMTQRLRDDIVTESNQRDTYQSLAPAVENGLYLVPKVLD